MTKLIAINPCFYTERGHNFYYLQSVEKACKMLEWDFCALVPKKNIVNNLEPNWKKVLDLPTPKVCFQEIEKRPYQRPRKVIRAKQRAMYYHSVFYSLLPLLSKNRSERKILFYEAYSLEDIRLIMNLLKVLPKKSVELWLIFRYPASFIQEDLDEYQQIIKKQKVPIKLITDTDLLKESLDPFFNAPISVFPIPLPDHSLGSIKNTNSKLKCWWPGIVRSGKGLEIIQKFAASDHEDNQEVELIASEEAQLTISKLGPKITALDKNLSKESYDLHLKTADFILMPYIDVCYEKTSSNAFVETIIAGKVPIVFDNTWMAYELRRFNLEKLIIDWNPYKISTQLKAISQDNGLKEKIQELQRHYKNFHNIETYSQHMAGLNLKEA